MKLTKLIFQYWKFWMSDSVETNEWVDINNTEGIMWCDGYCATFWWVLNAGWYEMNNKLYAKMYSKDLYMEPIDFY